MGFKSVAGRFNAKNRRSQKSKKTVLPHPY